MGENSAKNCGDLRSSTDAIMMAQLLPLQPNSERVSQLLPTVKCSSCNSPVAISALADHVCPPVSSAARTPPPHRPTNTTASQPRLRTLSSGSNARRATPTPPPVARLPPPPLKPPQQVQPPDRRVVSPRIPGPPQTPASQHPPSLLSNRNHTTSSSNTPSTPPVSSAHVSQQPSATNVRAQYTQPPDRLPPLQLPPSRTPYYPEDGIDTSTGGEAGMAGVGRRGFAAVARAAMYTANYQRRVELPRFLDIDAASRGESVTVLPIEAVTLMCCCDYSRNRNSSPLSRFFPFPWLYFSVSSNPTHSRRQNLFAGFVSIRNANPFTCVKSFS